MSIAKKLMGHRSLKASGHFDILDQIDKVLLNQTRQGFSVRRAKAAAFRLIDALEEGDRGKFLVAFAVLSEIMYAPESNRGGKVHPSRLADDCERRMYYEMSDVEPDEGHISNVTAQLQRIFDVGTWWHSYLQTIMLRAGILEGIEVRVLDTRLDIDGRADAVTLEINGKKYLVEIKTINSHGFSKVKAAHKPLDKHVHQASIYAGTLKLEWLLFIYVNKDTSELLVIHTPTDMKAYRDAEKKITDVQKAIADKKPPERVCSSPFTTRAVGCEYCNTCFKK